MGIREMAKQFRVVHKPSSPTTKLIIGVTVAVSVVTVLVLGSFTLKYRQDAEHYREKAQQLEQANQQLENKINNLGTLEGIKDIAQDVLGLVDPDTVIITPEN